MFDDDGEQDPVSNALRARRIPHGRSRNNARAGKASGRTAFDPLRAVGVYDVKYGSTKTKRQTDQSEGAVASSLTIHGLTPEETGLIASFNIGGFIVGMSILAGSRKGLNSIIAELERGEDTNDEEEETTEPEEENEEGEEEEDHDTTSPGPKSALEEEDDRINRRARAFEKNSFRNPKFWMRWRARVKNTKKNSESNSNEDGGTEKDEHEVGETNTGYIVFSGNDCATFEGTLTSEVLGWDNMRIQGRKVKSHAGECQVHWGGFE